MMVNYGERFIEHKIEGDKIIRISEFKVFPYDYSELIENIQDYITDDYEALAEHKIYYDWYDNLDNFEVDSLLEWLEELLEDADEDDDYTWFSDWKPKLESAKGFTIHPKWKPDWMLPSKENEFIEMDKPLSIISSDEMSNALDKFKEREGREPTWHELGIELMKINGDK